MPGKTIRPNDINLLRGTNIVETPYSMRAPGESPLTPRSTTRLTPRTPRVAGPPQTAPSRISVAGDQAVMNVTFKHVQEKRRNCPNGIPMGTSLVHVPLEKEGAGEFSTYNMLKDQATRHVRYGRDPNEKFVEAPTTQFDIGWMQPAHEQTEWLRRPDHPISRSHMVRYYENMIQCGITNVLRPGK